MDIKYLDDTGLAHYDSKIKEVIEKKQDTLTAGEGITIENNTISSTVTVDIATTEKAGIVKPDGTTITIDENGVIASSAEVPNGVVYTDYAGETTGDEAYINADYVNKVKIEADDDTHVLTATKDSTSITDISLGGTDTVRSLINSKVSPASSDVSYSNTESGLTATNVQDAIDEVKNDIPDISGKQDATDNNLETTSKTVTGAINELNSGISDIDTEIDKSNIPTALSSDQKVGEAISALNTSLAKIIPGGTMNVFGVVSENAWGTYRFCAYISGLADKTVTILGGGYFDGNNTVSVDFSIETKTDQYIIFATETNCAGKMAIANITIS